MTQYNDQLNTLGALGAQQTGAVEQGIADVGQPFAQPQTAGPAQAQQQPGQPQSTWTVQSASAQEQPQPAQTTDQQQQSNRSAKTAVIAVIAVVVIVVAMVLSYVAVNKSASNPGSATQTNTDKNEQAVKEGGLSAQQAQDFPEYYEQNVDWTVPCSTVTKGKVSDPAYQCAQIEAPLDWTKPTAGNGKAPAYSLSANPYDSDQQATIKLAVIRTIKVGAVAGDKTPVLFTNPGGPGGSGVDFMIDTVSTTFSADLKQTYMISSWDPRGVGYSTAISCWPDDKTKLQKIYETIPGNMPDNFEATKRESVEFTDGCKKYTGSLLKNVGTESTVRDLDLIRSVVAKDKLNYLGFSYGTYIGQVFAGLFPEQTGRIVLDGIDDATQSDFQQSLTQAKGFEVAITSYLTDCINNQAKICPFAGKDVEYGKQWIKAALKSLHNKPQTGSDGREFSDIGFLYAVITPLYSQENWKYLSMAIQNFKKSGDLTVLQLLSDSYFDYTAMKERFESNSVDANSPINCNDIEAEKLMSGDTSKFDLAQSAIERDQIVAAAPTLGEYFAWGGLTCDSLPADNSQIEFDQSAPDAAPILLLGALRDPATPYESAVAVHNRLKNSTLLTSDSDGHCAYITGSEQLKSLVDQYLITGAMPEDGQTVK